MKLTKRLIALLLSVLMLFSLTACADTTWVYESGDNNITAGVYLAYQLDAYARAESLVKSQENGTEKAKALFKQTLDDMPVADWIKAETEKACMQHLAVEAKFDERSLELSEKDNNVIDQTIKTYWEYIKETYEENGVSSASYRKVLANTQKRAKIFTKYYDKDGIEEVAKEDLFAHFKENFASVNMYGVKYNTGDDLTDEKKAENDELKAKAKEYVEMINSGEKTYNETYDMYYHDITDSEHDDEDETDVIEKDADTAKWIQTTSTTPSEKVIKAIFDTMKADGTAKLIPGENVDYVVVRYDVTKDEKNFDEMRTAVLKDIKGDDFDKLVEEWTAAVSATSNASSLKKYNPKNIVIVAK